MSAVMIGCYIAGLACVCMLHAQTRDCRQMALIPRSQGRIHTVQGLELYLVSCVDWLVFFLRYRYLLWLGLEDAGLRFDEAIGEKCCRRCVYEQEIDICIGKQNDRTEAE